MTNEERIQKLRKFTQDPDWALVQDLMKGHLAPLLDVTSIDASRSNDEIASEVRGRQMTIASLSKFLNDAGIVSGPITRTKPITFK